MTKGQIILFIGLLILIIIFYDDYYSKPSNNFELMQSPLKDVRVEMLLEKNPIIINETIVNPDELTYTLFKWLYFYKQFQQVQAGEEKQFYSRYAIVYTEHEKTEIRVQNPLFNEKVSISLVQNQCMIIPHKWIVTCMQGKLVVIEMFDLISFIKKMLKFNRFQR